MRRRTFAFARAFCRPVLLALIFAFRASACACVIWPAARSASTFAVVASSFVSRAVSFWLLALALLIACVKWRNALRARLPFEADRTKRASLA